MSEYQYDKFRAIDRSLSQRELAGLPALSSRARKPRGATRNALRKTMFHPQGQLAAQGIVGHPGGLTGVLVEAGKALRAGVDYNPHLNGPEGSRSFVRCGSRPSEPTWLRKESLHSRWRSSRSGAIESTGRSVDLHFRRIATQFNPLY